MEKIIISNSVKYDLDNLIKLLYQEEYFGFLDSAEDYVSNILDFIYSVPNLPFKETKNKFFGKFYCSYKHSRNTTWYATFDYENETYLIKNIANNHSKEYAEFIGNIQ
jgi:hypothetical protein